MILIFDFFCKKKIKNQNHLSPAPFSRGGEPLKYVFTAHLLIARAIGSFCIGFIIFLNQFQGYEGNFLIITESFKRI
jgi:hypothetical protein